MKSALYIVISLLVFTTIHAQEFNPHIDKDSLFSVILKNVHPDKKKELSETYSSATDDEKEFLLFMFSMPRSSKAELIANLEKNKDNIFLLRSEYQKLVPKGHTIYIRFISANKLIQMPEMLDLRIYEPEDKSDNGESQLEYGSKQLKKRLERIGWNENTLQTIKKLLNDAGCISIQNGKDAAIGFAQSGLAIYSYRIFDKPLTKEQMKEYNDDCMFIYYKDNIVLEYLSGATGPLCFPD